MHKHCNHAQALNPPISLHLSRICPPILLRLCSPDRSFLSDGQIIATGGQDAKVKLWNVNSGFCFVTFPDHTSSVTDILFTGV